ncbi:MAG: hypothetical protein SPK46_03370 [Candidatus Onthovivens sp.]
MCLQELALPVEIVPLVAEVVAVAVVAEEEEVVVLELLVTTQKSQK